MPTAVFIVAIVIGIPVVSESVVKIVGMLKDWRLKAAELKIKEKQIESENAMRLDAFNAKILRMDDLGLSATDIVSLTEEVRQLRQEVRELRQSSTNQSME